MEDNFLKNEGYQHTNNDYNEINLEDIYNFILRNKKSFLFITTASIFLFGIASLIIKKTWIGEFIIKC